jgi:signal peptide peptidase SppA
MNLADFLGSPWAISRDKLGALQLAVARLQDGHDAAERGNGAPLRMERGYEIADGVAVIQIAGIITKRASLFTRFFGGTASEQVAVSLQQALADHTVKAIVLHIDSPGGAVDGTADLADAVFAARGQKPVIALADGLMASAAYWIGSAAGKIYSTGETTAVGSIGVVAAHLDVSGLEGRIGVKTTEIYAGKYKRIASSYKPLTDEGRKTIQEHVDYLYSVFVGAVAKHRGVSEESVQENMADGRIFIGSQAIRAGLVDGVATLAGLVAQYGSGRPASGAPASPRLAAELADFFSKHSRQAHSTTEEKTMTTRNHQSGEFDEASLKRRWDSDADLRAEFCNDFKICASYFRANAQDRTKTYGGGTVQRGR